MSNSGNTTRFDNFYIEEDHSTVPKEYFKEAYNLLEGRFKTAGSNFIDIGCAAGDFIKYIHKLHPGIRCNGLDVFENLLIEAKKRVPSANFHLADMNLSESIHNEKYDIVTMLGVLSIFSNENWIKNFASLIGSGGVGLIFGMINPYPYDVFVRLRNQQGSDEYGWNAWSAETITKRFYDMGFIANIKYWQPPVVIPQRPLEPLRSWTNEMKNGSLIITNGSRMIHDFAFVIVHPR